MKSVAKSRKSVESNKNGSIEKQQSMTKASPFKNMNTISQGSQLQLHHQSSLETSQVAQAKTDRKDKKKGAKKEKDTGK